MRLAQQDKGYKATAGLLRGSKERIGQTIAHINYLVLGIFRDKRMIEFSLKNFEFYLK
jgi:hypothetical protein